MLAIEALIILALISINGLLAMSELAVVSSRRSRLKTMAEQGRSGSRRALALASDPGRFLSSVQIGITLVGVLSGAFSGATLGIRLADALVGLGMGKSAAEPVAVGCVVTAITFLSLIAGELVPKQLALRDPEGIACMVSPAMTVLASAAHPFVWLLDRSSRFVLAVFGRHAAREETVTEEEIRTLVAEAETAGVLEPEERAMISAVMRLGDRPVRAVMTPRNEVDYIDLSEPAEDLVNRVKNTIHSRLPACESSLDRVVGILQAKDLLDHALQGNPIEPRRLIKPAPVIPDTMDALDVMGVLKSSPVHIGLVHDEYGQFLGVVTSGDILNAIAGRFHSPEGPAEPPFVKREDGSYLISGSMGVEEMADLLGVALPEKRSYHTVAGLIVAAFGRLPQVGEAVLIGGWRCEVVDMDGRRVDKILAERKPLLRRVG
jgi:putative hemolysin